MGIAHPLSLGVSMNNQIFNKDLHKKDLNDVALWLKVSGTHAVKTRMETLPLSKFNLTIERLKASYVEFPQDKKRTDRIVRAIRNGDKPNPVYIEDGDETMFIMEGRHRIVAFNLAGIVDVNVYFCSRA